MFNVVETFRRVANGNEDAYRFLITVFEWLHGLDDLIDRDKAPALVDIHNAHFQLIATLSKNPFYQKHAQDFLPIFLTSAVAHIDSERFRTSPDVVDRITSQILKSEYQNLFYYTAYLVGGFRHAVEMSRQLREYDFDPTPVPATG